MITRMKYVSNLQIAKAQPKGVAYHLHDFFANFSLAWLIKVLPI